MTRSVTPSARETPSHPAIICVGLTKFYGATRGIQELNVEVQRGEIFGFLGPNGAGKTTTMRLLLDLIRPTTGRAIVLGLDPREHSAELRRRIGYLPGDLSLYGNLTGRQLFSYLAGLRSLAVTGYADELCTQLELDPSRRIRDLSKGNKQKIGLIQALMHRPALLILDEPTSGLDPLIQHEFRRILSETAAEERTVLLSSHVLSEVENVASRVGIVRAGRLVAAEDVATLRKQAARRFDVHLASGASTLDWSKIPGVSTVEIVDHVVRVTVTGGIDPLLKALHGYEVLDLVSLESDLEDTFLSYYTEAG